VQQLRGVGLKVRKARALDSRVLSAKQLVQGQLASYISWSRAMTSALSFRCMRIVQSPRQMCLISNPELALVY
jgi:hypothetical protein